MWITKGKALSSQSSTRTKPTRQTIFESKKKERKIRLNSQDGKKISGWDVYSASSPSAAPPLNCALHGSAPSTSTNILSVLPVPLQYHSRHHIFRSQFLYLCSHPLAVQPSIIPLTTGNLNPIRMIPIRLDCVLVRY